MSSTSSTSSIFSMFSSSAESQTEATRQSEYVRRSEEIVVEGTQRLARAVEGGQDLVDVFDELLTFLAENRHEIAVSAGVESADQFGKKRDVGDLDNQPFMLTTMGGQYAAYNEVLISDFQTQLHAMAHTVHGFQQKTLKVDGEPVMGRKNSTEFVIIDKDNLDASLYRPSIAQSKVLHKLISKGPFNEEEVHHAFTHDRNAMYQLKKTHPEVYKKMKLTAGMAKMYSTFKGSLKSHWVLVTRRTETDKKMYASSQYLTWMHCNYKNDPVENMTDTSFVGIIHHDSFLIQDTLSDVAQLFKQSIETDSKNREALINLVGLLEVQLAHATPFHRGSAAISEWLEQIIYRHHGLTLTYTEGVSVNLKALTLDLKPFIDQYPEMIELVETPNQVHELGSFGPTI
jgi:hypothetical protein